MRKTRSEDLLVKHWGEMPAQQMKQANPSIQPPRHRAPYSRNV